MDRASKQFLFFWHTKSFVLSTLVLGHMCLCSHQVVCLPLHPKFCTWPLETFSNAVRKLVNHTKNICVHHYLWKIYFWSSSWYPNVLNRNIPELGAWEIIQQIRCLSYTSLTWIQSLAPHRVVCTPPRVIPECKQDKPWAQLGMAQTWKGKKGER